jgi:hypothetical protein
MTHDLIDDFILLRGRAPDGQLLGRDALEERAERLRVAFLDLARMFRYCHRETLLIGRDPSREYERLKPGELHCTKRNRTINELVQALFCAAHQDEIAADWELEEKQRDIHRRDMRDILHGVLMYDEATFQQFRDAVRASCERAIGAAAGAPAPQTPTPAPTVAKKSADPNPNPKYETFSKLYFPPGQVGYRNTTVPLKGVARLVLMEFAKATDRRRSSKDLLDTHWGQRHSITTRRTIQPATLTSHVHRAREALRQLLQAVGVNVPKNDPLPCIDEGTELAWELVELP